MPLLAFLLGASLGLESLAQSVKMHNCKKPPFSQVVGPFYIPTGKWVSVAPCPQQRWGLSVSVFIAALLMVVESSFRLVCAERKLDANPLERQGPR